MLWAGYLDTLPAREPDQGRIRGIHGAIIKPQARFMNYPGGGVSLETLKSYGFTQTSDVEVRVGGTPDNLVIMTRHGSGKKTYIVQSDGGVTSSSGAD